MRLLLDARFLTEAEADDPQLLLVSTSLVAVCTQWARKCHRTGSVMT